MALPGGLFPTLPAFMFEKKQLRVLDFYYANLIKLEEGFGDWPLMVSLQMETSDSIFVILAPKESILDSIIEIELATPSILIANWLPICVWAATAPVSCWRADAVLTLAELELLA